MATYVFLVGVDQQLERSITPMPYVEGSLKQLENAFLAAGVEKSNLITVTGPIATRSVVLARLLQFLRELTPKDDAILVLLGRYWISGHGPALVCSDTIMDDPEATILPDSLLIQQFLDSRANNGFLFLDRSPLVCKGQVGLVDEDRTGEAQEAIYASDARLGVIISCDIGETSHSSATMKATLFSKLLADALQGRLSQALTPTGELTMHRLHQALQSELPKTLRKQIDSQARQTPKLFGQNTESALFDFAHKLGSDAGAMFRDASELARVFFRKQSYRRVKDLTDWRKSFQQPDAGSASSRKFVARIALADTLALASELQAEAREVLNYKRKELELEPDPSGAALLRTPDFTYTATAQLDTVDPSQVCITEELSQISSLDFLRSEGFAALFQARFDQFTLTFYKALPIEQLIDRLEDQPPPGIKLQSVEADRCELMLVGQPGRMVLERQAITVIGRGGLLDLFLNFLAKVGPLGSEWNEQLTLPAARENG